MSDINLDGEEMIEYREYLKLKAENAALRNALRSSCDDEREMAISEGPGHSTCGLADELTVRAEKAEAEVERLREALSEIRTSAHCIAKAGPLNTPTLQDAWSKFMMISAAASGALAGRQEIEKNE
jgi:hypothetical protein